MEMTICFSAEGSAGACVRGSSTVMPVVMSGAVIMKMMSSTSMTSTSGVTLMSAIMLPPPCAALESEPLSPTCIAMGDLRRREVALDDVEEVGREVLHVAVQDADARIEVVVRHDGRNGGDQPGGRRDQRVRDVRADGLDRRLSRHADLLEGEQDAH